MRIYFKLFLIIYFSLFTSCEEKNAKKRPFYIIGHMVNSIPEIKPFLDQGANVLESDISFYPNGSVKDVYHGPPCECFRDCMRSAKLSEYLDYLRHLTDPSSEDSYNGRIHFQFFDMKLSNVLSRESKYLAGQDMADHVLYHLWGGKFQQPHLLKVLLYINTVSDAPTLAGFRDRFREKNVERLLENVAYDAGVENTAEDIHEALRSLNIDSNVWQGDGIFNCLSPLYPDLRLKEELQIRDRPDGYINKVYHWTIDDPNRLMASLKLGVDGMITNVPGLLNHLLKDRFEHSFRLPTIDDHPFVKFIIDAIE